MPYDRKKQRLQDLMNNYTDQDVLVAFSGGVDSAVLLKAACQCAKQRDRTVHAVTVQTTLHPVRGAEITKKLAEECGAVHHVIAVDELQHAGIMDNPVNRCYLCKKHLFGKIREMAGQMTIDIIIDGTNADDLRTFRPGIRALEELQIASPLAEAGLTKADVRRMAKAYGLPVADRPSEPCLATRFPYGTKLSEEAMRRVEQGEDDLRQLGFYNIRLRVHGDIARIEIDSRDISRVIEHKEVIVSCLKKLGYVFVTVDLEGFRSGSMDYGIIDQD